MSPDTITVKRKLYESKYGKSRSKNVSGTTGANFDCSANQPEDYANWLAFALKRNLSKRFFKIKVSCRIPAGIYEDIWVYDRYSGQLKYFQRVLNSRPSKVTGYRVYKNVDDAAIHILAKDKRTLDFVNSYAAQIAAP